MRQRRPKDLDEKLLEYSHHLVANPKSMRGKWCTDHRSLFLEIGSGKGRFITELAEREPDNMFIGFEGQDTVIIRVLEKIEEKSLNNILMCQHYINDFSQIFAEDELAGIYLNFSDPWPKARHEKRRLTSNRYLPDYAVALKPGGFVKMKTDNDSLFEYSLEQFKGNSEFDIIKVSRDLHNSDYAVDNIMTEYEKKFSNYNKKINYVFAEKRNH